MSLCLRRKRLVQVTQHVGERDDGENVRGLWVGEDQAVDACGGELVDEALDGVGRVDGDGRVAGLEVRLADGRHVIDDGEREAREQRAVGADALDVAGRDDTDEPARLVDHRHGRDALLRHDGKDVDGAVGVLRDDQTFVAAEFELLDEAHRASE